MSTDHPNHTQTNNQPETQEDNALTAQDWNPQAHTRRCACGAHITRRFQRTHGDRRNHVHACLECVNPTWLPEAAANPDLADHARHRLDDHQTRGTAGGYPGGTQL